MSQSLFSARALWRALTPGDVVVCVAVLLTAAALSAFAGRPSSEATHAIVTVGRSEAAKVALTSPGATTVDGRLGPVTLEVRDGAVRVTASGCPHHVCIAMGEKRRSGEILACAPNALLVRLVGGAPDDDVPDAVSPMTARRLTLLAVLVAVATTLQIAESLIPKPLPWLRLGLANGATLLVIARLGARPALGVTVARTLLAGLLLGTLGGPSFALSASGGLVAWAVMAGAHRTLSGPLSLLGVSVLGSAAHVGGQLGALALLTGAGSGVLALSPVLALTAVPLGLVTGAVALSVHRRLAPWREAW